MPQIELHHGTFEDRIPTILEEGLDAPSYWGTADEASSYGDGPVIVATPEDFDDSLLMPNDLLIDCIRSQDENDDGIVEWDTSDKTWQDSLRIFGSVRYDGRFTVDERHLLPNTNDRPPTP